MDGDTLRKIGGFFPLETMPEEPNRFIDGLCNSGDDLKLMMSGRCGIMLCIEDWMQNDKKRVAYLPAYTCETVSGCFYKCGYEIIYYDLDRELRPQYNEAVLDGISLFLTTGYYGFTTFDSGFIELCRGRGIGVIADATHTVFSQGGAPENADYVAASFRKWLPVACGGLAIKRRGIFNATPSEIHKKHLELRYKYIDACGSVNKSTKSSDQVNSAFWDAELMLREIYLAQEGDEESAGILKHYPVGHLIDARRRNFETLSRQLGGMKKIQPVFKGLEDGAVPSHYAVYCRERDRLQELLREKGIYATVYWPVPPFIEIADWPGARWIYENILSLPCDQRYGQEDMLYMAEALIEADSLL